MLSRVKSGDWLTLEEPFVQDALQNLGFSDIELMSLEQLAYLIQIKAM